MKAIDVLCRVNRIEHQRGVDLLGQRQLNEYAVYFVARVQITNQREQLFGRRGLGQVDLLGVEPKLLAGSYLAGNVDLRCRIAAYKHRRKSRSNSAP